MPSTCSLRSMEMQEGPPKPRIHPQAHLIIPRSVSEYLQLCRFSRSHSEGLLLASSVPDGVFRECKELVPRALSEGLLGGRLKPPSSERQQQQPGTPREEPRPPVPVEELKEGSFMEGQIVCLDEAGFIVEVGATSPGLLRRRCCKGAPKRLLECGQILSNLQVVRVDRENSRFSLALRGVDGPNVEEEAYSDVLSHIAGWAGVTLQPKEAESKLGFTIGGRVTWKSSKDTRVPASAEGVVVGFADDRVKVQYPAGIWDIKPDELVAKAENSKAKGKKNKSKAGRKGGKGRGGKGMGEVEEPASWDQADTTGVASSASHARGGGAGRGRHRQKGDAEAGNHVKPTPRGGKAEAGQAYTQPAASWNDKGGWWSSEQSHTTTWNGKGKGGQWAGQGGRASTNAASNIQQSQPSTWNGQGSEWVGKGGRATPGSAPNGAQGGRQLHGSEFGGKVGRGASDNTAPKSYADVARQPRRDPQPQGDQWWQGSEWGDASGANSTSWQSPASSWNNHGPHWGAHHVNGSKGGAAHAHWATDTWNQSTGWWG